MPATLRGRPRLPSHRSQLQAGGGAQHGRGGGAGGGQTAESCAGGGTVKERGVQHGPPGSRGGAEAQLRGNRVRKDPLLSPRRAGLSLEGLACWRCSLGLSFPTVGSLGSSGALPWAGNPKLPRVCRQILVYCRQDQAPPGLESEALLSRPGGAGCQATPALLTPTPRPQAASPCRITQMLMLSVARSCPTPRPHGLQHARPAHPSPSPRVCPSSCPEFKC